MFMKEHHVTLLIRLGSADKIWQDEVATVYWSYVSLAFSMLPPRVVDSHLIAVGKSSLISFELYSSCH